MAATESRILTTQQLKLQKVGTPRQRPHGTKRHRLAGHPTPWRHQPEVKKKQTALKHSGHLL